MREVSLTAEQKAALESQHKQARDSRESDRIKTILLRAEGWPLDVIAQALRKPVSSIVRPIDDYQTEEKLSSSNGGSASKLNAVQTDELVKHLTEHTRAPFIGGLPVFIDLQPFNRTAENPVKVPNSRL